MMSKTFLIFLLTLFCIDFGQCNVIDYLNEEEKEKEILCENWDEGSEEKDECLEELCLGNDNRFECKALKCKLRFPISIESNNLKQNISRLRCIKRVCSSNEEQVICQNLRKCNSEKKGPLGKAAYIICVTKLFV